MITANQTPEQLVCNEIDNPASLREGWPVESKNKIDLAAGTFDRRTPTLKRLDKIVDKNFQDWIFKKQAGPTRYTT